MDDREAGYTIRLNLLLRNLDVLEWRAPLKHIGTKTASEAEMLGLIEVSNELYRLTPAGAVAATLGRRKLGL